MCYILGRVIMSTCCLFVCRRTVFYMHILPFVFTFCYFSTIGQTLLTDTVHHFVVPTILHSIIPTIGITWQNQRLSHLKRYQRSGRDMHIPSFVITFRVSYSHLILYYNWANLSFLIYYFVVPTN